MFEVIKIIKTKIYPPQPIKEVIKEILREALFLENIEERSWKGWWMSPSAGLYEVYKGISNYGHYLFAKDYLKKRGIETSQPEYDMLQKGWIRITFNREHNRELSVSYASNIPPNEKQITEIKNLSIEYNASKIVDKRGKEINTLFNENMSYQDLIKLTMKTPRSPKDDTNRIDRSRNVKVRSIPVTIDDEGHERWNFRYKSSPQTTVTDQPFQGRITFKKGEVQNTDNVEDLDCEVDCGCPDYQYKFAYNNVEQGAGNIGPHSLNTTINRKPKPEYDIGPGLCKHLCALAKHLKTQITNTGKSNLFEAINDVANQGPFNVEYYD